MLKNQSKKVKQISLIIILFLTVTVVLGISYMIQQKNEKLELQLKQETEQLNKIKKQYKEYRFTDKKDKKTYKNLILQYETDIKEQEVSTLYNYRTKINQLDEKLRKQNTSYYNKQVKKLKKKDLSNAYDNEKERIREIQTQIKACIKNNTFRNIDNLLKEWKEMIQNMSLIADNLSIQLKQIDPSSYPAIDLYLSFHDINTNEVPTKLDKKYIYLTEQNGTSKPKKATVSSLRQLKENGVSNVNIVTSLISQKDNRAVASIQKAIKHLLREMQSQPQNKVELLNTNHGIRILEPFTSDKDKISKKLNHIKASKKIGFYDALYTALIHTKMNSGAKYIIAFTDGVDNASHIDYPEVVELANRYQIPIYLIGIGNEISTYTLERISSRTGGFYRNINDETLIEDIITMIYKEQNDLYQLTYMSEDKSLSFDNHNLLIAYQNRLLGGYGESSFIPAIPLNNSTYPLLNGIDIELKKQLMKKINEKKDGRLLFFEIIQVKNRDKNTAEVEYSYVLEKKKKNKTLSLTVKKASCLFDKTGQIYHFKKQLKKPTIITKF